MGDNKIMVDSELTNVEILENTKYNLINVDNCATFETANIFLKIAIEQLNTVIKRLEIEEQKND